MAKYFFILLCSDAVAPPYLVVFDAFISDKFFNLFNCCLYMAQSLMIYRSVLVALSSRCGLLPDLSAM
jgi:hypothetical protein